LSVDVGVVVIVDGDGDGDGDVNVSSSITSSDLISRTSLCADPPTNRPRAAGHAM